MNAIVAALTKPTKVVLVRDFAIHSKQGQHKKCEPEKDTNAVSKQKQNSKPNQENNEKVKSSQLVQYHEFAEGEQVWARMRGFPLWPAKV